MSFEAMGRKPDGTLAGLPLTADGKLDTSASVEAPVGGATSAKQDEQTVYLDAIEGKLPALGQALAAASVPVVLPAAQITSLTAPVLATGSNTIGAVTAPGAAALALDATVSTLSAKLPSASTPADTIANPSTSSIMALSMGWNPSLSQWGRPRIDSTNYFQVRAHPTAPASSSRSTALQIQRTIAAFSCTPKVVRAFTTTAGWIAFFNASSAVADSAVPFGGHIYRVEDNQTLTVTWDYNETFTTGLVVAHLSQVVSGGALATVISVAAPCMFTGQYD